MRLLRPLGLNGRDEGSTIPLIIGIFVIAFLVVAGSVAAGDAFVQQTGLQSTCDGAAVAAASSADVNDERRNADGEELSFLRLADVQTAVEQYLARDPARASVQTQATLSVDRTTVAVACSVSRPVTFGAVFGFSSGVVHHATSTARAQVRGN
jgi:hypothetical protein